MNKGVIVSVASLAGGQGKTTVSWLLARAALRRKLSVMLIDLDPQSHLTLIANANPSSEDGTVLDVLCNPGYNPWAAVKIINSLEVEYKGLSLNVENKNFLIIPSDERLQSATYQLINNPRPLNALRQPLLSHVVDKVDLIIVDSPPSRTHLALAGIGTADYLIIPCICGDKGLYSLIRTCELMKECFVEEQIEEKFLGVVPFNATWVGYNPTETTRRSIDYMSEFLKNAGYSDKMLPHVLNSEVCKSSVTKRISPGEIGRSDLENFTIVILDRLFPSTKEALVNV